MRVSFDVGKVPLCRYHVNNGFARAKEGNPGVSNRIRGCKKCGGVRAHDVRLGQGLFSGCEGDAFDQAPPGQDLVLRCTAENRTESISALKSGATT